MKNDTCFTGRILDNETKNPIDAAKVTLEFNGKSEISHTDSEGFYQFTISLLQQSISVRVHVDKNGYQKYNRHIPLSTNNPKIDEFYINPIKQTLNNNVEKPGATRKKWLDITAAIVTIITGVASLTAYMVSTNPATSQQQALSKTNCDPSYPGICIPQNSPNLKCADIKERNFKVLKPDPHGFDRDGNGIGCEK